MTIRGKVPAREHGLQLIYRGIELSDQGPEFIVIDHRHLTPKHSGDLGVATKEPRKGRPAATGRVLLRLVKWP